MVFCAVLQRCCVAARRQPADCGAAGVWPGRWPQTARGREVTPTKVAGRAGNVDNSNQIRAPAFGNR